jgi:pyruvate formate lyase activating enzyme
MKEAMLYEKREKGEVRCHACAHQCVIKPGKRGICAVRQNVDGTLHSLVYGRVIAINADPIEKKPLFHYLPGTRSLSIATVGCNFRCEHCQNYEISQYPRERPDADIPGERMTAEDVVEEAARTGCASIAYTYTEPTIFIEFCHDTARLARERGIGNVFVSNGFMTPESARLTAPLLDANNIDLKGGEEFYKKICHARAAPVRETIRIMKAAGVWVEVTTLVIPGHNDSDEQLRDIAAFIAGVSPKIPWHVTRFHPTYHMLDRPATPVETLRRAVDIGRVAGVRYIYEGNVPEGESTFCPGCGELLVERLGFSVGRVNLRDGTCPRCGMSQAGRWRV